MDYANDKQKVLVLTDVGMLLPLQTALEALEAAEATVATVAIEAWVEA